MWICEKRHGGIEPTRAPIDDVARSTMVRWYTGRGDEADEKASLRLVQEVKLHRQWFACDCLGSERPPPLMAPAYLEMASTFYLRRLTGQNRPEHDRECPFYRSSFDYRLPHVEHEPKPVRPVDGYLDSLKPLGQHLAQRPDETSLPAGAKPRGIPRLARILWTLLDRAELNCVAPDRGGRPRSILGEFSRLRAGAEGLELAPDVAVTEYLWTHSRDLVSGKIYQHLESSAPRWPADHKPQCYLILFARSVSRHEIETTDGPVQVVEGVERPEAGPVVTVEGSIGRDDRKTSGPYLVILAIGEPLEGGAYQPVRAFAQPIVSGHYFVPVEQAVERVLFESLREAQLKLADRGKRIGIIKPLFDLDTPAGPCRPQFLLQAGSGKQKTFMPIEMVDEDDEAEDQRSMLRATRMTHLGTVLEIPLQAVDARAAIADQIERLIG
jgi:hypothetical protein